MQTKDELINPTDVIKLFTYQKLQEPRPVKKVSFKYSDQLVYEACLFATGGYYQLDLKAFQPAENKNSPTKEDRIKAWMRVAKKQLQEGENKNCGWKIHISVSKDPQNIQKAWDTLLPILVQYKIGSSKIPQPNFEQDADKVLTVYAFKGGPKLDNWSSFLKDVESAFRSECVIKGDPIEENRISNSDYFYYRNDEDSNGKYNPVVDMKAHAEGPFKDIDMQALLSPNSSPIMAKK